MADNNGTHWQASALVGRANKRPQQIRRTATSRREATRLVSQAIQVLKAPQNTAQDPTAALLWEQYTHTEAWRALSDTSRRRYQQAVTKSQQESPHWWAAPVTQAVTPQQWDALLSSYADQHGTKATETLRTACSNALHLQRDTLNLNTIHNTPLPKRPHTRPARLKRDTNLTLTPTQLSQLVHTINALPHERKWDQHAALAITINSILGLRAGELHKLTRENINTTTGEVTGITAQKTGTPYPTKTLPQWVTATIPNTPGPLFPMDQTTFYLAIRRAFDRAGHPNIGMHNIRKTVGSIIFDQYGARAAAEWLAHASVRTTLATYIKPQGAAPTGPITLYTPTQNTQ